ncbi:MAG: DUF58 domain-containing protein [Terriglobales bacterium]
MSVQPAIIPPTVEARCQAYGRLGVAFGLRFFLLLLVGLVWLGPAFINTRFLYAMLAWDVLVLLAWAVELAGLPKPSEITVARAWTAPVALSVPGEVELTVCNGSRNMIHTTVLEDVPQQLRPEMPSLELSVTARGEASKTYAVRPVRRGDVQVGSAYLRYEGPFRIAQRWASAALEQTVRVYPNLREAQRHAIYLTRSRQIELEKRYTKIRGAGREFDSLREYRPGDEIRDVCWTASARRGKPVTKLYQMERSQTVWVVVDCGRLMRTRVADLSKIDYAANAALSLAQVALWSGDRVGLLAYGRKVRRRVLPHRGSTHLRQFIEALALVEEETSEADHLQAASVLLSSQKRRSLVVWITDLAETARTPEVIRAASEMMPRHLVLLVVIGQPDLARLAATEPQDARQMFETVAAQEVIHRRELLLARLRQQGALTLEVASVTVSTAVVNAYLQVKQRSQL